MPRWPGNGLSARIDPTSLSTSFGLAWDANCHEPVLRRECRGMGVEGLAGHVRSSASVPYGSV